MTTMVIIAYIPKKVVFGLANFPRLGVVLFSCGERIGSVSVLHSYEIETLASAHIHRIVVVGSKLLAVPSSSFILVSTSHHDPAGENKA